MSVQVQGVSGRIQASLLAKADSSASDFTKAICRGLSRVIARAGGEPAPLFGQRYAKGDGRGVQGRVAGYRVIGDKFKGVEPGFVAKRDWSESDSAKLQDPAHKFHASAQRALVRWLDASAMSQASVPGESGGRWQAAMRNASGVDGGNGRSPGRMQERPTLRAAAQGDAPRRPGDEALQALLHAALARMVGPPAGEHADTARALQAHPAGALAGLAATGAAPGFKLALASAIILSAEAAGASDGNAALAAHGRALSAYLRTEVMNVQAKFDKKHYIKLDYYEADKFMGKYHIPTDKAKGMLHRWLTGASAKARNEGAVREALANDLMRSLGIQSQKLKLVESVHADGTPKLMLDGTHVDGFSDFDGKPEKGERYLKDGVLVRNQKRPGDPDGVFTGPPRLDLGMSELGRNKILLLLMADRDALGSTGGNKGYVGNSFIGIDPGHALEGGLLGRRGDVRSDFSFAQPGLVPSLGYKNFSMFDQSTLAEKMEGVRMIASLARSKADTGIFDSYAREFGSNRAAEADFARNLNKTKQLYEGRRDDILRIFQERLAVDTFQFGVSGGGEHVARRDACLNLLDCLEKLTSPTVMTTRGGIGLAYPQIADPDQRREWRVRQDAQSGELVFSCAGTPRQIAAALRGLEAFPGYQGVAGQGRLEADGGALTFRMPRDGLPAIAKAFSYEAVARHKH